MVEIRPVHRHQGVPTTAQLMRHPPGEAVPYGDAVVAHDHPLDELAVVDGVGHRRVGQLRATMAGDAVALAHEHSEAALLLCRQRASPLEEFV